MSDNRNVAKQLLGDAAKTILQDRPGVHGSAENSFEMIADLWTVYLRHARRVRGFDSLRPEDVSEMMSMLKKARKIYGASNNVDNDVDDIGYTALAGMLRLPDPDKESEDELVDKLNREAEKMVTMNHTNIDSRPLSERKKPVEKEAKADA